MSALAPPAPQKHEKEDPGAQELAESSDDHFSDASEGQRNDPFESHGRSRSNSNVPVTRVERVDDNPSYGEVPGTHAYKLRTQDAVPDEIEIVPEGARSRSASRLSESDRPLTPGGTMIPKTIVEKVEPDEPSHGEVPGTPAWEKRRADADPDEIVRSPIKAKQNLEGEPTEHRSESSIRSEDKSESKPTIEGHVDRPPEIEPGDTEEAQLEDDGEGFGDDFDDFEEGEEVEGDDFGDFGDVSEPAQVQAPEQLQSQPLMDPLADIPSLSLQDTKSPEDVNAVLTPYLKELFPSVDLGALTPYTNIEQPHSLLSDRSSSLWSQLVAPPPLQPPNWIKSRIRRLFLVSLGVPVDLDEILPASKQKKLVLPSINFSGDSPWPSNQLSGVIRGNASSTSVATTDSKTGEPRKERKKKGPPERAGPPPPPNFDSNAASRICSTTEAALSNFSDDELTTHVNKLESTVIEANSVLEYWLRRKDSALGDKEAFEGVIENLVGFVTKSKSAKPKR
ncbi:hypothetical protein K461DRAFT_311538 [Myriangium duriaei CBS 260.36]|uniref:Uncharacterized protein n=1 Tax=Myriangium duriaei CBS 260.36 TaxID=1168546 RepID=A0A9P4J708_9PEZI|nr:hypothetical protein K461DRAFT_311538 [Myriangium duriaei CBS 260.36]